jgi:hypothetical protein
VRKNFIKVSPSIQHADNFSDIVRHAVKDAVRTYRNRSQSRSHLVSRPPRERVIFEQPHASPTSRTILSAVCRPATFT